MKSIANDPEMQPVNVGVSAEDVMLDGLVLASIAEEAARRAKRKRHILRLIGELLVELANLDEDDTPEVTNKTHSGSFMNEEGQTVDDLHIEFNVEGVEYVQPPKGGFPNSETDKDNKKQINLSGGNVNANGLALAKFKKDKGDFEITHWYWTKVDSAGNHQKVGETKDGPPSKNGGKGGKGDWQ